ncbi:AtzE family amidohydrolase [Polaromonas sp.]|uniref:AtzE family amidohydrolase n=1 Tax=Polaromonas sp. TaxID=1869339 RepID=UPI0035644036
MKTEALNGLAAVRAIAIGEISAVEALQTTIDHIEATNARVNAFTGRSFSRAHAEAAAVDAKRARGEALGPLAGLPYAVKNLFDIAGEVTLAGSTINRSNAPASEDAFLVQRLQAAGAVLVGSLNMDEYAYGFTTENTHYGPCRNPHDLTRIAGGSSGGSGTAVAAGQVPLALGSDTNGSIRVPASLCGVWGLKPTFGRLSRRGTYPFVHSLDHLGPLADSVETLALAYDAMQGPDALDPGCHALQIQAVSPGLGAGMLGLRIGVLGGYFSDHATPAARAAVASAAAALGASDTVEWPDAALARAAAFIVGASEGGTLHLNDLRTRVAEFEPLSVDRFIAGALQPGAWYVQAQRFRRIYRDKVNALFKDWDLLLAPATPVSAPEIGTEWLDINGTQMPCRPTVGLLTQPISFAGCPVAVAPIWPEGTGGMPIGVQLIAPPWREDLCLRAAGVLQMAGVAHLRKTPL